MSFTESNKSIEACFPKKHLAFVWKHQETDNHLSLSMPCSWCKTPTSCLVSNLPSFCFQPFALPVSSSVYQGVLGDLLFFPCESIYALQCHVSISFLFSYPFWSLNSLQQEIWGVCLSLKLPCTFSVRCLIFKSIFWNVGILMVAIS